MALSIISHFLWIAPILHNMHELRSSLFALISVNILQISDHFDLGVTLKWISQSPSILSIFFKLHPLKSKGVADAVFDKF